MSPPSLWLFRSRVSSVLLAVVLGGALGAATPFAARSPERALALVLAGAVSLLAVQSPRIGVLMLVALTYANAFAVLQEHGLPSAAFPFALLLVAPLVLMGQPTWARPLVPRAAEGTLLVTCVYGGWLVATSFWAIDPDLSLRTAGAYWKLLLVVVAVLALVRSGASIAAVIWVITGVATVLAIAALTQRVFPAATFFGFATTPDQETTSTGQVTRLVGPLGNPNAFAQLLVVAVPLALSRVPRGRLPMRLIALACATICAGTILLTYSRGGSVGLGCVLVLCAYRLRRWLAVIALAAAIAVPIAGSLSGTSAYSSRVETLTWILPWHSDNSDPSLQGRASLAKAAVHIWRQHPLGGVGYANFPESYASYDRGVGTDLTLGDTPHSTPLEVASETGLVGLAIWALLMLKSFLSLRRARWVPNRRDLTIAADFLAISLVGYLATALFLAAAYSVIALLLIALSAATVSVADQSARES